MQNINCLICHPYHQQIAILLCNLKNVFQRKKCNSKSILIKNLTQSYYIEKYQNSFVKLLNFIFEHKLKLQKQINCCLHQLIYQVFEYKTGFSVKQLDYFAEQIYECQAKRKYQIDILLSQIKSFSKTIQKQLYQKQSTNQMDKKDSFTENTFVKLQHQQDIKIETDQKTLPDLNQQQFKIIMNQIPKVSNQN